MTSPTEQMDLSQFDDATPGPWHCEPSMPSEGFNCYWITTDSRRQIATVNGEQSDENGANARLIASAPALLEECKRLRARVAELEAQR